ncbi:MAG TPA: hypothetical protein PKE21_10215 [Flavobacteriales bacterium]|nr:hypothetical protein [Flavobacteriales bacterium]HMR27841.1 hypothetical protein [Flavobacteriales bacterium]
MRSTALLLATLAVLTAHAQCPTGTVTITSQGDADAYAATYAGCDTLPADLIISGINIDDLTGFSGLHAITGDLVLTQTFPGPYDLTGFGALTHIGGDLLVTDCQRWRSFNGLQSLQRVEGDLRATYVDSIEGLQGLGNLRHVGGDLEIWGGDRMSDLGGLNQLDTVQGSLYISVGAPVSSAAVPNTLDHVGDDFRIAAAGAPFLTGGAQLSTIGGQLQLGGPLPTPSALPNLSRVGALLLAAEGVAQLNILANLDTVEQNVRIGGTLTSFSGLNAIAHIGDGLEFLTCPQLVSITAAFQGLDTCGKLWLEGNAVLSDITAFDHPFGIGQLEIDDNPQLSYCHVQAVCDRVLSSALPVPAIMGNASGCASRAEVQASCISTSTGDPLEGHGAPFPNPAADHLFVPDLTGTATFTVHDATGRVLLRGTTTDGRIGTEHLPTGAYRLVLERNGHARAWPLLIQ